MKQKIGFVQCIASAVGKPHIEDAKGFSYNVTKWPRERELNRKKYKLETV